MFFCQQARADRHRHGQNGRHGHGYGGHKKYEGELQSTESRIVTEERNGNNHRHQNHREDDQVITNLQHGALEMADGVSTLHQLRGLAEVGVRSGGIHHRVGFAPLDNRTRKHRGARFGGDGQGFSG